MDELYNQLDVYLNEFINSTNDRQSTILMILDSIDEAIASFERNTHQSHSNVRQNISNDIQPTSMAIFNISTNCTCDWVNYLLDSPCGNCIAYSDSMMTVAAIAAGFSVRGWSLAVDLIWLNRSNTTEDIHYWPSLGYRVTESSFIKNNVVYKPEVTAGVSDDDIGRLNGLFDNVYTGDTYNSLGAFWYSKTGANNGNVAISIIDRYDWTRGPNSSGGVFNNTMAFAQEIGVVT